MCLRSKVAVAVLVATVTVTSVRAEPGDKSAPACGPDALGTTRTLAVGTKGGLEVGLKSYPQTLPLADHEVVLTFDDGPSRTTPAVLAGLAHECVKATFFLIGRNAEAEPALVKRELAEGHTLGHHTFSHPTITLRRMGTAAAEADIDHGFAADDIAAYGAAGPGPRVPFFRFPGFADTKDLDTWLAARNIAVFGTDLWALDWQDLTPRDELDYLIRRLDEKKRGIILLHDTRASTAAMLPAFLRALKAKGYHVVNLVPGPGTNATTPAPKGWTSETDRVIAEVFAREATHGPLATSRSYRRTAFTQDGPSTPNARLRPSEPGGGVLQPRILRFESPAARHFATTPEQRWALRRALGAVTGRWQTIAGRKLYANNLPLQSQSLPTKGSDDRARLHRSLVESNAIRRATSGRATGAGRPGSRWRARRHRTRLSE